MAAAVDLLAVAPGGRHSPEFLRYVPAASPALAVGVSYAQFQAAVQMHVAGAVSNAQIASETAARMAASPHAAAWAAMRALYQEGAGALSSKACALAVAAFLLEHGTYPSKPVVAAWASQTHNGVPLGIASTATRLAFVAEAETAALGEALGVHVTRLATIAHGDGVCTTVIPIDARRSAGAASRSNGIPQSHTNRKALA